MNEIEAVLDRVFPPDLRIPLPAMVRLYANLAESGTTLSGQSKRKGAYPGPIAEVLERVREHFRPSGYSMSPAGIEGLASLVALTGISRVLEFGAGITTFVLPSLAGRALSYLSIDEDEGYAATVRAGLAAIGRESASVVALPPADAPLQVIDPEGGITHAARFRGLQETVAGFFGDEPPELVLIDGPSRRMRWGRYAALIDVLDLLPDGTVVALDDALRPRETHILQRWAETGQVRVLGTYCFSTGLAIAVVDRSGAGAHAGAGEEA